MANTFKFGNGEWAVGKETALAYNDENSNFKPLPFTFDRASTATVVNSDGLIETVGADEPRIDFLNNTKGHLLLEPSRSNLVTYSEDFSQWATNATITPNSSISPDGTLNASLFSHSGGAFPQVVLGGISFVSGSDYIPSLYVKSDGTSQVQHSLIVNGVVVNFTPTNQWVRISDLIVSPDTSGSFIIAQNSASSVAASFYIWGAQLEEGSYATSYIPTSGSAVTRSVDTTNATVPSGVFGTSEGTIYAEGIVAVDEGNGQMPFTAGTDTSNLIYIWIKSNGRLTVESYTSTKQCGINSSTGILSVGDSYKIAFGYANNDFVLYLNGTQIGADTSGSIAVPSNVKVGTYIGSGYAGGKIKQTKIYNTRLSNSELAALTT